jgi:hypothetical protein
MTRFKRRTKQTGKTEALPARSGDISLVGIHRILQVTLAMAARVTACGDLIELENGDKRMFPIQRLLDELERGGCPDDIRVLLEAMIRALQSQQALPGWADLSGDAKETVHRALRQYGLRLAFVDSNTPGQPEARLSLFL